MHATNGLRVAALSALLGLAACPVDADVADAGALGIAAEAIAAPAAIDPPSRAPASRDAPDGYRVMKPILRTGHFGHAVLLLDTETETFVPIFIGGTEALSIQLRLAGEPFSRPLTHDLFDRFATELGAKMIRAQVDRIVDGVYTGTVVFERAAPHDTAPNPTLFSLDARPSDAIALAIGNRVPIYVAEPVFEEAGIKADDLGDDGVPPRAPTQNPVEL